MCVIRWGLVVSLGCKPIWKGKKIGIDKLLSHSKTPKEASWVAYFGGLETPDAGIRHSKRQINIWLINDVSVYQKSVHRINHDTYTLKSVFLCFFFFFAAPLKLVDVSQPAMVCVCVCARTHTHACAGTQFSASGQPLLCLSAQGSCLHPQIWCHSPPFHFCNHIRYDSISKTEDLTWKGASSHSVIPDRFLN